MNYDKLRSIKLQLGAAINKLQYELWKNFKNIIFLLQL